MVGHTRAAHKEGKRLCSKGFCLENGYSKLDKPAYDPIDVEIKLDGLEVGHVFLCPTVRLCSQFKVRHSIFVSLMSDNQTLLSFLNQTFYCVCVCPTIRLCSQFQVRFSIFVCLIVCLMSNHKTLQSILGLTCQFYLFDCL